MVDDAESIEIAETEVARLIDVCHHSGLNFWQILRIFLNSCLKLQMLADVEFYMRQGK